MTIQSLQRIAWFSKSGQKWEHLEEPVDLGWPQNPQPEVYRISIGTLGGKSSQISEQLRDDFQILFPNLHSLHLWNLKNLTDLPQMPSGLAQLDIQGCPQLARIRPLPESLDTLVLQECPQLTLEKSLEFHFPNLLDLSIKDTGMETDWLDTLLDPGNTPKLQGIVVDGIANITQISHWPATVTELTLTNCLNLTTLPDRLPPHLRKLDLFGAKKLEKIPDFPPSLDFINLIGTDTLTDLPAQRGNPSTLKIFQSGLVPPELFGQSEADNMAEEVYAFLAELENGTPGWDHEVKVILLGNGFCGKTSLVRRLKYGPPKSETDPNDPFNKKEDSTHGIKLWRHNMEFPPVDGVGEDEFPEASLNIWDFAGQDLYHNTHRLFLQTKAVFIVCCTGHKFGADEETDHVSEELATEEADKPRPLSYWLKQLANLPFDPQIIVVRTKSDRGGKDAEANPELSVSRESKDWVDDWVDFSALTGSGLGKLEQKLRAAIGQVIGKKGQRRIPRRLLDLKAELQIKKQGNQTAYEADKKEPPYPYIERAEFDLLVQKQISDSVYSRNTDLALDFLHQSGFLHADGHFLPEQAILDLRWALDGIYTIFDRAKSGYRERINANFGRFTTRNLLEWTENRETKKSEDGEKRERLWTDYSESHQKLFLGLMQEHNIAFVLLNEWQAQAGNAVYLAPSCLPESDEVQKQAARERNSELVEQKPIIIGNSKQPIKEGAILALMVKLGRIWQRSALFWKWGGQIRSFRRRDDESVDPNKGDIVHLDWTEIDEADDFGGSLKLTLFGDDFSFVAEIIAIAQDLLEFHGVSFPEIPGTGDLPNEGKENHQPKNSTEAAGVEVSFSYAGGDDLETWPLAIQDALPRHLRIIDYREEQYKDEMKKIPDRREFLDYVGTRDFVSILISEKYLESEYCLYELMKVYQRLETPDRYDAGMFRVGVLDESIFSQDSDLIGVRITELSNKWKQRFDQREENLKQINSDREEVNRMANIKSTAPFYTFISKKENLENLFRALFRWKKHDLGNAVDNEKLNAWVTHIISVTSDGTVLLKCAKEIFSRSQKLKVEGNNEAALDERHRAIQMCLDSYRMLFSRDWREQLNTPWEEGFDDDLRTATIIEADKQHKMSHTIS